MLSAAETSSVSAKKLKIKISPFLMCFFFLYKSLGAYTLKIETLPFPLGLSPLTQIEVNRLFKHTSFVKGEIGIHIDKYRPLIMPPSFVRQAVANNTAQSDGTNHQVRRSEARRLAARSNE